MANEQLEPWTGVQRSVPVLGGVIWVVVGLLVVSLAFPEIHQHWEFLVWGIAIVLGGLFILYLRLAILPSVRKF